MNTFDDRRSDELVVKVTNFGFAQKWTETAQESSSGISLSHWLSGAPSDISNLRAYLQQSCATWQQINSTALLTGHQKNA